jgi:hypothetical protein
MAHGDTVVEATVPAPVVVANPGAPPRSVLSGSRASYRTLTVVIIVITVVLLFVIVAQGFLISGIVENTSNQTIQEALSIIVIIVLIVLFFALIYCAYSAGSRAWF